MNIPDSFKSAIKNTFFDKTIEKYSVLNTTDAEGSNYRSLGSLEGSFNGNVRYDRLEEVKKQYGIEEEVDAYITTDETVGDAFLKYQSDYFEIIENVPFDSHNMLFVKKWLLTQSGLISS